MFAAHLAAGLAIKAQVPKAPALALLTGAFVPDLVWIGLATVGVERTDRAVFFDDWSHSLVMVVVWGIVFALPFLRLGAGVAAAVWAAVFSHFLLDLPFHPKDLALYPYSNVHLGWNLWDIGADKSLLGATNFWWAQLVVLLVLLAAYALAARARAFPANLIGASCVTVVGLHLLMA
jgi:hypothetical protein